MKKLFIGLMIFSVLMTLSCCKKDADEGGGGGSEIKVMAFDKEQYDLTSGSVSDCRVSECEKAEFSVINTKIADIVSSKDKECRIEGKKEGATVIKAVNGNNECRAVINVINNDKSRSAFKDSQWYICSFACEGEGGEDCVETFFTEGKPVLEREDDVVAVMKGNGRYVMCYKNKFFYFEYEAYRG